MITRTKSSQGIATGMALKTKSSQRTANWNAASEGEKPTELVTAKNQAPEDFSRRFRLTDKIRTVPFGAVGGDQTPKYFGRYSRSSRRTLSQQSES